MKCSAFHVHLIFFRPTSDHKTLLLDRRDTQENAFVREAIL